MEKTSSALSYIFIGFVSFVILSALAGGMFYLGRIYTLREFENEDDKVAVIPEDNDIEDTYEKEEEIEYETKTLDMFSNPNNTEADLSLKLSVPKGTTIEEDPLEGTRLTYNGAYLQFIIVHMGFPKGVRKYEIIPNSNLDTKLYRVTYKDGKIAYITDYEDKDINECSSPDIENPTLPCGLSIETDKANFYVQYTGEEENLDAFDLIMSSMDIQ